MLELNNVSKSFSGPGGGDVTVLSGSSMKVAGGEIVAVHGLSGCGKSTMLLIAGALLEPNEGEVLIDGANPYSMGANERSGLRAGKIGFVFQQFHLVPYLNVRENILSASIAGNSNGAGERADELIEHFGMDHRQRHLPYQLSTGERQRVALARAVFNRPTLLLADEPTGNLDDENAKMVFKYLCEFAQNGGAVLVVTHDSRSTDYAGRVLTLKDGTIS
jgi:ABC-type lipoprotein export system ATPase subunit